MSAERFKELGGQASQQFHDKSMQGIEYLAGTPQVKWLMKNSSSYLIEQGRQLFAYNGLDEAIGKTEPLLESGHKLVILSSHKSHGEIAPAIHIMERFMAESPELDEFVIPVAASMAGGQQGNIIKTLYEDALVPNTKKRNIKTLPVVTDNDVKKRGMKLSKFGNGRTIHRPLTRKGTGFFIFIEGSVQGGRTNPETGTIFGLQKPDSMLQQLLEYSKKSGVPLAFLTTGMVGTHKLFSAEGKFFTPEWIKAMAVNKFNRDATFADVNIGSPISTNQLNLEDIPQAAENLMMILSSYLPYEERGMYQGVEYLFNN
jgi:hypothetical protein